MSLLIGLKQRIKIIETIRKTTHAMRLISMSNNARLRNQKAFLEAYQQEVLRISQLIQAHLSDSLPSSTQSDESELLLIIVGSEKGLCGTFNTNLIRFVEQFLHNNKDEKLDIIGIGKQLIYALPFKKLTFEQTYPTFNQNNFTDIVKKLTTTIIKGNYKDVIVISTYPHTFFIQAPITTSLFSPSENNAPSSPPDAEKQTTLTAAPYSWEGDLSKIAEQVLMLTISSTLQILLFQSLLAEQAARFISMDSATQNAENLLETMKLDYNKVRQALITRELSDLISSII